MRYNGPLFFKLKNEASNNYYLIKCIQRLIDIEVPRLLCQYKEQQILKQSKQKLSTIKQTGSTQQNNLQLTIIEQSYLIYCKAINPVKNRSLLSPSFSSLASSTSSTQWIELVSLLWPFLVAWDKLMEYWIYNYISNTDDSAKGATIDDKGKVIFIPIQPPILSHISYLIIVYIFSNRNYSS